MPTLNEILDFEIAKQRKKLEGERDINIRKEYLIAINALDEAKTAPLRMADKEKQEGKQPLR